MYRIWVWDNFHSMDDEEGYEHSEQFESEEAAIEAAKELVRKSCQEMEFKFEMHSAFGYDASVIGPNGRVEFSARAYAKELCDAHQRP